MIRIVALLIASAVTLIAQMRVVRVGDVAPRLNPATVIQGDATVDKPGRSKLIEFWAAYCPSCVANISHFNELTRQFNDRPIDFVSINSFESEDMVRKFLKQHPIEGLVSLDPGAAEEYGISAIPVAILIARDGHVAAIGHPSGVTASVLNELLSERPISLPLGEFGYTMSVPRHHNLITDIGPEDGALVKVVITPAVNESALVTGDTLLESSDANLRAILSYAFDLPPQRILLPDLISRENYAIRIWVPPDSPQLMRPLVQDAVTAAASITAHRETKEVDVLLVDGFPGKLTPAPESKLPQSSCSGGRIDAKNTTLAILQSCFETITGKSVIFASEFKGQFDVSVTWDSAKPDGFQTALKDQLGLALKPGKRELDVLVVEPRQKISFKLN